MGIQQTNGRQEIQYQQQNNSPCKIVFCSIGIFLSENGDKNVRGKMHMFVSGHSL